MIGREPNLNVSEDDDFFHPPTSDAPSWIETLWFPCWIPEERITISTRLWFSPNIDLQGGAISAWRDKGKLLFGDRWSEPMQSAPDLTNIVVPHNGLSITRLTPLSDFKLSYQKDGAALETHFSAIMAPNPVDPSESPGMFEGHFEQPGRVQGRLTLRDKEYAIDCYAIRDRSWGPRSMPDNIRLGNAYAANSKLAFFTYIKPDADGVEHIVGGYYKNAEGEARILRGQRRTQWRDGLPVKVEIEAVDALGRELRATGNCVNVMASNAGHGVYGILNLLEWSVDGGTAWGENHDIWSETEWLAAGRAKLP